MRKRTPMKKFKKKYEPIIMNAMKKYAAAGVASCLGPNLSPVESIA